MNPLQVLGLKPGASKADIKAAHRKMAALYHPDKPNGNADKFKEIQEAYEQATKDVDTPQPTYQVDERDLMHDWFNKVFAARTREKKEAQRAKWKKPIVIPIKTTVTAKELYEGIRKTFKVKYTIDELRYQTEVTFELLPRQVQKYTLSGRASTGTPLQIELTFSITNAYVNGTKYSKEGLDYVITVPNDYNGELYTVNVGDGFVEGDKAGDLRIIKT